MVNDILSAEPPDDAGSETLARYSYQVQLAAVACLSLFLDDSVESIVCEWAEDYVVIRSSGSELVSVKHLEPSQGSWSIATICTSGGLRHLFEWWKETEPKPLCRLQTNGGLKTGPNEAKTVAQACKTGADLERIAELVVGRIGASSTSEATQFLKMLTIEDELPKRDDLMPRVHSDLDSLVSRLGWSNDDAKRYFKAVLDEVWEASSSDVRAAGRSLSYANGDVTAYARARARKTINRERLDAALARSTQGWGRSKLVTKLRLGGFGPTGISKAKRLRNEWLTEESKWETGLGSHPDSVTVRNRVQDLAEIAETETNRSGVEQYGEAMKSRLLQLLHDERFVFVESELTDRHVLGIVYDETDECNIWWSDIPENWIKNEVA